MAARESSIYTGVIAATRVRMHRITHESTLASLGEPILKVLQMNEIKKVSQDIFLFKNFREEQIDGAAHGTEDLRG